MPSESVSSRHGSVPRFFSSEFDRRSLSWSESSSQTLLLPPPSSEPELSPTTTGESRFEVKELNLPASTRSFSRVGCWALLLTVRSRATRSVTVSTSFLRDARRGFTNAERPLEARKMTVFCLAFGLKLRPLMVSVPPTLTRIGETLLIAGGFFADFLAKAPGAATSAASATSASRQPKRFLRYITYPLFTVVGK